MAKTFKSKIAQLSPWGRWLNVRFHTPPKAEKGGPKGGVFQLRQPEDEDDAAGLAQYQLNASLLLVAATHGHEVEIRPDPDDPKKWDKSTVVKISWLKVMF